MSASAAIEGSRPGRTVRESPVEIALLIMTAVGMTILPYVVVGRDRGVWQFGATLAFVDFAAFGLTALVGPRYLARLRRRELHTVEWGGLAFFTILAATFTLHPSARGLVLLGRFGACLAIASYLTTTSNRNRLVLVRWLGIASVAQCVIAVLQRSTRAALGLGFLGETLYPFRPGYPVPTGTMRDPYPLAGFGLFVAALFGICLLQGWIRGRFAWVVLVSGGVLTGLSGSRAAMITLALIVCSLVVSSPRRGAFASALIAVGFVACAIPSHQLWLGRTHVVTSKGTEDVSNGRSALTEQATGLIRRNPLVGVGPGNYSTAVRAVPELAKKSPAGGILPVHNMPLMAVAESGALVVAPMLFVFAAVAHTALRNRFRWLPAVASIVPYLMLDLVFWFYPEGLLMIAIAIAFMHADWGDGRIPGPSEDAATCPVRSSVEAAELAGVRQG